MSFTSSHSPIPDRRLAVVLGGGGATGNAWQIGVLAGLAAAGVHLDTADLVIGTSAGATTAAQLRSGIPLAELFAATVDPPASRHSAGHGGPAAPALPMSEVYERMRAIGAAARTAAELHRAMGAFGLESDAVLAPQRTLRRAVVASRLPSPDWPDRPTVVTAIEARTGELVLLDGGSGVDLADAVTASTALPGLVPTHPVGGRELIDGGIRSSDNADLAAGFSRVVVLSPLGGPRPADADVEFEGLRRLPGADLASQIEGLRASGSRVEVVTPDGAARASMGARALDPAARPAAARGGFQQAEREAARIRRLVG